MGNQRCKPGLSLQSFSFFSRTLDVIAVQTVVARDGGKTLQEYCDFFLRKCDILRYRDDDNL